MTCQEELIKNLIAELELSIKLNLSRPCILNAQNVAKAKHELHKFFKECGKNGDAN